MRPQDVNGVPTGSPPTPTGPPPTPTGPPPTPTGPTPSPPTGMAPPTDLGMALFSYGGDPPSSAFPLGVCEGDCDVDVSATSHTMIEDSA